MLRLIVTSLCVILLSPNVKILATTFLNNSVVPLKICGRVSIWQWNQFEPYLRGCTVIEGSLQIHILFDSMDDVDVSSLRFPELKEITGFLMLFSTESITSLNTLFPSLSVIRGQELVEYYAIVITKMPDLLEVGLSSLTQIYMGGVWIVGNDQLCHVDTIDWGLILGRSGDDTKSDIIIRKNAPSCSNICPELCKSSTNKGRLCWNEFRWCQFSPSLSCPQCRKGSQCFGTGQDECCHQQCAGFCNGPLPTECHVCKNVGMLISNPNSNGPALVEMCLETCPEPYYKYLGRRCLTMDQCLNTSAIAPKTHPTHPDEILNAKTYNGTNGNLCVLDCPMGSMKNGSSCIPCKGGRCYKVCPGGTVDTIEALRRLSGCTKIAGNPGHLKIHIRTHSTSGGDSEGRTLVSLLEENLGQIKSIDDYLFVSHTYALFSLDFLQSLRIIKGKVLADNSYAVVIKSNDNIEHLWSLEKNVSISNHDARVMFHYNPRLCPQKIYNFLARSGVKANQSVMDIGITNGDKVTCNTKNLMAKVIHVGSTFIDLQWENFGRNLTAPSYLLNYEVHYKETSSANNETKLALRDPCGQDGWNIMDVSPLRDENSHQHWIQVTRIDNLLPYTNYAIYIKAIVLPGVLYALNNNTGAESIMLYKNTTAGVSDCPADLNLFNPTPDVISAHWTSPIRTNGPLTHFKISLGIKIESNVSKHTHIQSTNSSGFCDLEVYRGQSSPSSSPTSFAISSTTLKPNHRKNENTDDGHEHTYAIQEADMLHIILGDHLFTGARPPFVDNTHDASLSSSSRRKRETSEPTRNLADNYNIIEEQTVPFSVSVVSYHLEFKNLKHFTSYYVEVKACLNETCSSRRENFIRTPSSPTADIVRNISYTIVNCTDDPTLILRWEEPSTPNGGILAYFITFKEQQSYCISRDTFLLEGNSYRYPELLNAGGNYSVKIQTKSHAGISNPSEPIFILVDDIPKSSVQFGKSDSSANSNSNQTWIGLLILLCLFLLTGVGAHFYFMYKRVQSKKALAKRVSSVNPRYKPFANIPVEWEIPKEQLEVDRNQILGVGSFGTIYKALLRKEVVLESGSSWLSYLKIKRSTKVEKITCAIKELNDKTPLEDKADLLREALLMTQLDCPHVIKLLGIVSIVDPILIVMEYMENKPYVNGVAKYRRDLCQLKIK